MSKSNKFNIQWTPSRQELIFAVVCVAVLGFFISFVIIAYTPVRNLIPGYPNAEVKYRQMQEAMRLDSLERSIFRWEIYSENLRRVINGEKPIQIDSLIRQADIAFEEKSSVELTAADSSLRSYVQEEEKFEISDKNKQGTQIDGLHFFKPLTGTLSRHYETAQHPYIDITAPEGSAVKSVLDGSVIFTSWNEADNWTIVLQHQNGIISVYKHNRKLLKGTADKVSAGTTIALLGTSAAIDADDTHLHFELWKDGAPLDPET
ncbi:MAG: M23 family metallopeptidase, partial [Bacteroidales bacterium]|nr:M23 family metallopeptidase [Bacteroidales bacterium]